MQREYRNTTIRPSHCKKIQNRNVHLPSDPTYLCSFGLTKKEVTFDKNTDTFCHLLQTWTFELFRKKMLVPKEIKNKFHLHYVNCVKSAVMNTP